MEGMWLARDKDGTLALFLYREPHKGNIEWWHNDDSYILLDKNLFPEVKWSDAEPTKVKLEIVKQ